ncbi:circularly permuted type 2 ATP-grasp protein [Hansschlegelia beijingensis]|uniref:Putative circularly permuted ATP-grasp superfamily protein/putative alpha-E superfamily protein n=1 Tax=Hansschlegelia beijingensis TaxID=1133344 RepID=A0A7W6D2C8_9HYPH|nr:putative circularly permuted ATP-grasp superfamily protein/putative alpha-E superfamily protein [Hansschlegelia beijingensis]
MPRSSTADAPTPSVHDERPSAGLLRGYRPPAGVFDEAVDDMGGVRPHYRPLIAALAAMDEPERERRFSSAAQYLREAGVYYRVYGGPERGGEDVRAWPLAQPPLIIAQQEWTELAAGLAQRALLLERLIADLYGERRLLTDGVLPPALLGRNPEFLRPLANQAASGSPLIRFIAVDLGRGPDGRWWVLGDRAQAPSGAGFALENRVATARAFPELIRDLKVQRLARFFQKFRETLNALDDGRGARVGVLSPGPHNETYFEHAYLARYLGFLLLEGGDLAVHGSSVVVRTVDGAKPIRVLWRRLDADFADPLELHPRSRIGTPGLARAVRDGAVEMVNALGSGILETRALLAFQPALAQALLGEELRLPTVATWWCGQEAERDYVKTHLERLSIARAFPQTVEDEEHRRPLDLGMRRTPSERLLDDLANDPGNVVAQELVGLSTAPMFSEGRLEPRPVTLRVYLARHADGWSVMPGGFARVSSSTDPLAVTMQSGGRSVDVWVTSDRPERPVSLLGTAQGFARRLPSAPPARAADNLFWLGRYVERAEAATRLVRLHAARLAEGERRGPLEAEVAELLAGIGVEVALGDPAEGLLRRVRAAFETASRIRDRFSPDGWRVLGDLVDLMERRLAQDEPEDLPGLASEVLIRLSGFTGLVRENMYQFTGWRFLQAGRLLERGQLTARIAAALTRDEPPEGALEALLEFADSRITYRRRYSVTLSRETVVDLTVLDPLNPRSIAFQVNGFKTLLDELPGMRRGETPADVVRRAARLQVRLATGDLTEVNELFLQRVATDLGDISDLLAQQFFSAAPGVQTERSESE